MLHSVAVRKAPRAGEGERRCWSLKHEYQSARLHAEPLPVPRTRPPSEHRVRIAMAAAHPGRVDGDNVQLASHSSRNAPRVLGPAPSSTFRSYRPSVHGSKYAAPELAMDDPRGIRIRHPQRGGQVRPPGPCPQCHTPPSRCPSRPAPRVVYFRPTSDGLPIGLIADSPTASPTAARTMTPPSEPGSAERGQPRGVEREDGRRANAASHEDMRTLSRHHDTHHAVVLVVENVAAVDGLGLRSRVLFLVTGNGIWPGHGS